MTGTLKDPSHAGHVRQMSRELYILFAKFLPKISSQNDIPTNELP